MYKESAAHNPMNKPKNRVEDEHNPVELDYRAKEKGGFRPCQANNTIERVVGDIIHSAGRKRVVWD